MSGGSEGVRVDVRVGGMCSAVWELVVGSMTL